MSKRQSRIVIVGGGPGGYEAALVAAQLGALVTIIERDGLGGACVLTDCVPSKTLIATSGMMAALETRAAWVSGWATRASQVHPAPVPSETEAPAPGSTRRGCMRGSGHWPGPSRRT